MTREELEKEAEIFVSEKADKGNFDVEKFGKAYFSESSMKQALVKFAEPREKQIEIDAEHIRALQKQNGELTDKVRELEAYNEKLLQSDIDKHNKIVELSQKVNVLQKENAELKEQLKEEKELNKEIKARFVKCNTCTDDMKTKCLMFSENLCEGERCNELVDIVNLINKDNLIIH